MHPSLWLLTAIPASHYLCQMMTLPLQVIATTTSISSHCNNSSNIHQIARHTAKINIQCNIIKTVETGSWRKWSFTETWYGQYHKIHEAMKCIIEVITKFTFFVNTAASYTQLTCNQWNAKACMKCSRPYECCFLSSCNYMLIVISKYSNSQMLLQMARARLRYLGLHAKAWVRMTSAAFPFKKFNHAVLNSLPEIWLVLLFV